RAASCRDRAWPSGSTFALAALLRRRGRRDRVGAGAVIAIVVVGFLLLRLRRRQLAARLGGGGLGDGRDAQELRQRSEEQPLDTVRRPARDGADGGSELRD